jgi:hypothetical protein
MTNLETLLNQLERSIQYYAEKRRMGHTHFLSNASQDIGEAFSRLIDARYVDPEQARLEFEEWGEATVKREAFSNQETPGLNFHWQLIKHIDNHIENQRR